MTKEQRKEAILEIARQMDFNGVSEVIAQLTVLKLAKQREMLAQVLERYPEAELITDAGAAI